MRPRKRIVLLACCFALAGMLLLGLGRLLRPAGMPLDRAHAVAQNARWLSKFEYYWTAGNALTYFGKGKDGTPHLFRRIGTGETGAPDQEGPAVRLNGGYAGQLSPDGKWFVEWHQNTAHQRVPTFIATDGSRRLVGKPTWGSEGVWTAGGSSEMVCAVWRNGAALDIYRPDSAPVQRVPLPGLAHFYGPQRVDASGRLVGCKDSNFIMHFAGLGRIPATNYPRMTMVRVDLAHPDSKPEEWSVPVPQETELGTCLLAPSGDRLLWVVQGDITPAAIRRIRSYIPVWKSSPRTGVRWLVSGLHGEEMREIASYPYNDPRRNGYGLLDEYSHPRWMPDGKQISFIFRRTLYTRPVD